MRETGEELESKSGRFHTFETDPSVFSFSTIASSDTLSESTAFNNIAELQPDLVVQLGNLYSYDDTFLTSGMLQEATHESFKSRVRRFLFENHAIEQLVGPRTVEKEDGEREDS